MALDIGSNPLSLAAIAERLQALLGDRLHDVRPQPPEAVVAACDGADLKAVATLLKADAEIGYESLNLVTAVDFNSYFESVYHLFSWKTNTTLELHARVSRETPEIDTVTDLWPAADWLEREAFDMMGIRYIGHPDLRRILLKDDFIGHPLRKDYVDLVENHPHV